MKKNEALREVMTPMRVHASQTKKVTLPKGYVPGHALKYSEYVSVESVNTDQTMTQQQFKDEADINNIMRRYGADPVAFQALTRKGGIYADFSQITDYHGMLRQVAEAQDAFASLPAQIRSRFANDPGNLIAFLGDPKNYAEGVTLGLIEPKVSPPLAATSKNDSNKKTEAATT